MPNWNEDSQLATVSRSVQLRHSPEQLWPLLSATDKLNREWGLPSVAYTPRPNPRGGSDIRANSTVFGLKIEWEELPFEWIEPVWWQIKRVYTNGPLKQGLYRMDLQPGPAGTATATYTFKYEPRLAIYKLFTARSMEGFLSKAIATSQAADDFLDKKTATMYIKRYKTAQIDSAALENAVARLKDSGAALPLLERLKHDLASFPEEDVVRMRPFDVARRWNAPREDVLVLFMQAVRAGVLDLSWHTICPHCRGSSSGIALKQLRRQARCEFCNIDFDTEFDRSVEAQFTVNNAIRATSQQMYCVGGPGRTQHIHAQLRLNVGEKRPAEIELDPGLYRWRSVQSKKPLAVFVRESGSGSSPLPVRINEEGFEPNEIEVSSGVIQFQLQSAASGHLDVKLERQDWLDNAATAVIVTSLRQFQDLATKDLLRHDEEIAVRSVALLFSDLRGSTALYRQLGDAAAYALVREHFAVMESVIRKHRGGIVKTIGDAVMAVFTSAPEALRCCFEIQRAFVDLSKRRPETAAIVVKLGFHHGPCIAVNLNDRIDYFGTTVNVAARVQNESKGGDIVFLNSVSRQRIIQDVLKEYEHRAEQYRGILKGLSEDEELVRILPQWEAKALTASPAL